MGILVIAPSKRDYFGYPHGIILQNFVGGFVGGALSVVLTSRLAASLAATGVSRLVSMNLQNATGDANYSTWDIAKDVGLSMLVTTVTYGLTYGVGNKLNGNNYFKTYSDLPYLLGHSLTKGVEKGVCISVYVSICCYDNEYGLNCIFW